MHWCNTAANQVAQALIRWHWVFFSGLFPALDPMNPIFPGLTTSLVVLPTLFSFTITVVKSWSSPEVPPTLLQITGFWDYFLQPLRQLMSPKVVSQSIWMIWLHSRHLSLTIPFYSNTLVVTLPLSTSHVFHINTKMETLKTRFNCVILLFKSASGMPHHLS